MKKHSNRRLNKILKRRQKEKTRRNKKKLQSNFINFDKIDVNKISFTPLNENNIQQIQYENKPLIIKTPPIKISNFNFQQKQPTFKLYLNFDEANEEHNSFLNMLSEFDKQLQNMI